MNSLRFEEIQLGLSASFSVRITEAMLDSFVELSGDDNPLHTSSEFAKKSGFPDRVAHGLLTSSFYSRLVGLYLPGKFAVLHAIDISYHQPAFPNDELLIQGSVTFLNEAYKQIEIKASITNQKGVILSKAKIKVGIHE